METPAMEPYSTIGIDGGMMGPMTPAAAISAAEKPASKPRRFMMGIMVELMAAVSATAEPEMPAKNIEATTATWARPPAIQPTRQLEKRTRRADMPPVSIRAPARMKNGIAMIGNESMPAKMRWTASSGTRNPVIHSTARAPRQSAKAIGMPISIVAKKIPKSSAVAVTGAHPC